MNTDWARPVVHWEIESVDPERSATFYRELFNWKVGEGPIMSIGAGVGGPEPGPGGHIRSSEHNAVVLYVQVADLATTLARAAELGGVAAVEPFDVPGGPSLAGIDDPDGNRVMLVQQ